MDVAFSDVETNLANITSQLHQTHAAGAELTVFPECCVTGYCFESLAEAMHVAEPIPGPTTQRIQDVCEELRCHVIIGMLEADKNRIFNAAVLVGPEGVVGSYRKIHLPYLGIDRFATHGDRNFAVQHANELKVGMNICYDIGFPEAARSLTLQGADLIALPTNWPPGAECMAAYSVNTRAMENAVYYIAVNRVGTERGFRFIGQSRICDPNGRTISEANETDESIIYADIDLNMARKKRLVRVPGKHEIDRIADRRPEMYEELVKQHTLPRPGRDG